MRPTQLFIVIIVGSLFVVSLSSVSAVDTTITDPTGDVVNFDGTIVTSDPNINIANIDVTQITYTKNDQTATVTLKVDGIIENRGNFDDLAALDGENYDINVDMASYSVTVSTTDLSSEAGINYAITYINQVCNLSIYEGDDYTPTHAENLSTFTVSGDTLTVSFNLMNASEMFGNLSAATLYMKLNFADILNGNVEDFTDIPYYMDNAPNGDLGVMIDNDQYQGTVGESINFTALATAGSPGYDYSWNFGDGSAISTEQNPTHVFTSDGEFTVTLTVTDSTDQTATATATATILKNTNNGNGNNNTGGSSNILLFVAVIVIIVIVGTAIVIYILRR